MMLIISVVVRAARRWLAAHGVALALCAASFVVYVATLDPTVYGFDSAEFASGAFSLGIVHPPGYPLYLLIAHLFTFLPVSEFEAVKQVGPAREWIRLGSLSLGIAGLSFLLVAPWLWHVVASRSIGYPLTATGAGLDSSFYDLERLGPWVLNHFENIPLLVMVFIAGAISLWWRYRPALFLLCWSIVLLILSAPGLLGENMDTVTVSMSLFVQGSIMIGWLLSNLATSLEGRGRPLATLVWVGLALLCISGASINASVLSADNIFVRRDDLDAAAWIEANTPPSALFMVNLFHFGYSDRLIGGSDAGLWLPVLAQRRVVALPLAFGIERAETAGAMDALVASDQLNGNLTSTQSLALLARLGVTDVFIGDKGGSIVPDDLLHSSHFQLAFQSGKSYVFHIVDNHLQ